MMPVKPPAASAKSRTVGNQSRANRCLRCSGGVLIIAVGEYLEWFEAISEFSPKTPCPIRCVVGNVASHRSQNYAAKRHKSLKEGPLSYELFVVFCGAVIMVSLRKYGGDRLRQEPERSSRCMPGYL